MGQPVWAIRNKHKQMVATCRAATIEEAREVFAKAGIKGEPVRLPRVVEHTTANTEKR